MSSHLAQRSLPASSRPRLLTLSGLSMLLAAFMLVMTACGGSGSQQGSNKSNQPHVLTIIDSPKGDFTSNFNPFINSQNSRYGTLGFIYETLLYTNRYSGKTDSWLAATYNVSQDLKTITFNLRQGVKWSDGTPFTSDDVLYTFNAMKNESDIDQNGLYSNKLIQDVQAPDKNTVVVTLQHPSYTALWYIGAQTFIVQKSAFSSQDQTKLSKFTNDSPVGTGPFKLKSFNPQLFVYEKNPSYWQADKVKVDQVKLPATTDNTGALLRIDKGEIDWASIGYDPSMDTNFVNKDPQHFHTYFPPSNVVMLYLNLTKYPFNLLPVRQAISLAIDRDELKQKAAPYAPPANPTALLLPANQDYLSSDYGDTKFTVDTAKAESLLKSAGFTKGSDGIYADKNGKKLSFQLNVVNGWTDWQSDCQLIAADLKKIGMDIKVNALGDFTPYFSALQTGNYDMSISWTNPGPTPYYLYDALLNSQHTAPIGQAAPSNWQRWKDSTSDQLLNQYDTSNDPAVQKQAIQGLEKIMVEQLPAIPLTNNPYWYEYTTKHFTGWPSQDNPYAVPSAYNYPDNEYIILHLTPVS